MEALTLDECPRTQKDYIHRRNQITVYKNSIEAIFLMSKRRKKMSE